MNDDDTDIGTVSITVSSDDIDNNYGDFSVNIDHTEIMDGSDTISLSLDDIDASALIAPLSITDTNLTLTGVMGNGTGTGTYTVPEINNVSDDSKHIFGDTEEDDRHTVYIVEPWQSRKPIDVGNGMHVSLEDDLIPQQELKEKILEKMSETHPEHIIKVGMNPDNIKLVKNEVTIEIRKDKSE